VAEKAFSCDCVLGVSLLSLSVCRSLTTQYEGKQRFLLVFGQSLRMGSVQRMTEEPVFLFLVLVLASRSGFVHLDCCFHPPSRLILEKTTQGEKGIKKQALLSFSERFPF